MITELLERPTTKPSKCLVCGHTREDHDDYQISDPDDWCSTPSECLVEGCHCLGYEEGGR